jgi:hypothetical protein
MKKKYNYGKIDSEFIEKKRSFERKWVKKSITEVIKLHIEKLKENNFDDLEKTLKYHFIKVDNNIIIIRSIIEKLQKLEELNKSNINNIEISEEYLNVIIKYNFFVISIYKKNTQFFPPIYIDFDISDLCNEAIKYKSGLLNINDNLINDECVIENNYCESNNECFLLDYLQKYSIINNDEEIIIGYNCNNMDSEEQDSGITEHDVEFTRHTSLNLQLANKYYYKYYLIRNKKNN